MMKLLSAIEVAGEEVSPYKKILFALLATLIVVSVVSMGTAISGTAYT